MFESLLILYNLLAVEMSIFSVREWQQAQLQLDTKLIKYKKVPME
ncbi:hypothetical protein PNF35_30870 (plasmid) [Bacillus cereus]|nr:hypothetical protein [Bacillus cereus]MDC7753003.1 hypothetical protein [Bacillus cereus]